MQNLIFKHLRFFPPFLPPGICHTQEIKSVSRPHTQLVVLPFGSTRAFPALLARIRHCTRSLRAQACWHHFRKGPRRQEPLSGGGRHRTQLCRGAGRGRRGAGRSDPRSAPPHRPRPPPPARTPGAERARPRCAPLPRRRPRAPHTPAPLTRCSCSGPGRAGGAAGALLLGPGARSLRHSNAAAVHAGPRAPHHAPPRAPRGIAAPSAGRGPAPPRPAALRHCAPPRTAPPPASLRCRAARLGVLDDSQSWGSAPALSACLPAASDGPWLSVGDTPAG